MKNYKQTLRRTLNTANNDKGVDRFNAKDLLTAVLVHLLNVTSSPNAAFAVLC